MKSFALLFISLTLYGQCHAQYHQPSGVNQVILPLCPVDQYVDNCQDQLYLCLPTLDQAYWEADIRHSVLKTHPTTLKNGTQCQCLCGVERGMECDFFGICASPLKCRATKCVSPSAGITAGLGEVVRNGKIESMFDNYNVECEATATVALRYREDDYGDFASQCHAMKYIHENPATFPEPSHIIYSLK